MNTKQLIKQKVKIFLSLLLAGLLISLSSCKKSETTYNGKIGVLFPKEVHSSRWDNELVSVTKALEEKGFQVFPYSVENTNEMINYLEKFEKDGIDVLVIATVNTLSAKIATALENLYAKKTYIICYDRMQQNTDAVDVFITASSYLIGGVQADALMNLPKGSTIEIVGGDALDKNARELYEGLWSKIGIKIHSGEWTIPSGKTTFEQIALDTWSKSAAAKRFRDILDTYYKKGVFPDAVVAANDRIAQGIISVLEEMKVENYPIITGQDNIASSRELIKAGKQTMSVNKNPEKYIETAVATVVNAVNNKPIESSALVSNGAKQVPTIHIDATPVYAADIQ